MTTERKLVTTAFDNNKVTVSKTPMFVPEANDEKVKTTFTSTLTVNNQVPTTPRSSIYNIIKKTPGGTAVQTPNAYDKHQDSFNSSDGSFEESQEEEEEEEMDQETSMYRMQRSSRQYSQQSLNSQSSEYRYYIHILCRCC